jgi:hypothetical protein
MSGRVPAQDDRFPVENHQTNDANTGAVVIPMPNESTSQRKSEFNFSEGREVERAIVGIEGLYTLGNWRDSSGRQREFSCRVLKMSSGAIKIAGPVTGSVGEWVTLHLDMFGQFEGPVISIRERELVMRIVTTNDDRNKIARKIEWVENKKNRDRREHARVVPKDPHSTLYLPSGSVTPCQIMNYSISDAAVSADVVPEPGAILIVGKIVGRVTRQFPEGFAIEFLVTQDLETVKELFMKAEDKP